MGRILLRSLGPVWPLSLLTLTGAGLLWALGWPAEAFMAALAAAALGLLATPLTLLPGARLLAELRRADPGRAPDGSLWPGLSWALRMPPVAVPPAAVPAAGEEAAAQMSAAVRAIASEIALLKRHGTEMRRSFSEAVEAGHRMATAAETAGLWFDDTARRSTEAAATLGQLQAMAAAQATSLGTLTDHAGQALALLSDAAPGKVWLEAVMARVPDLPEQLDAALERVEAAAGQREGMTTGMTERMAAQVAALETAGGRLRAMTAELPEQVASLGAVVQQFDVVAGLPERFEAALLRGEAQTTGLATIAAQLEPLVAVPGRVAAALAQADAQTTGLAATMAQLEAMAVLPDRLEAALTLGEAQVTSLAATAAALHALPAHLDTALLRTDGYAEQLAAAAAQLKPIAHLPQHLDAALLRTDQQMARLASATSQIEALATLPTRVDAAFAQVEAPLAEIAATARQFGALAEVPGRLDLALARSEAQIVMLAGLPERLDRGVATLAGSEARLQAAAATLEGATLHLGAALPQAMAERLEEIAAPLHRAVAGLTEAGEALAPVAAGMAGLVQQIPRLESAIDRAAEAPRQTAAQLAAVTGAIEAMIRQARPSPGRSVSARILGQLDAEAEPAVTATLLRLDGVETEVEQLLRRAEHLVEGPGGLAPVSPGLARHAPELLEGLDATIRQLQSVATAIAVAADRGSRQVAARA